MTTHQPLPAHLLEKLFDDAKYSRWRRRIWSGLKYILSFTLLFFGFFTILNFPAYLAKARYFLNPPIVEVQKTVLAPADTLKSTAAPQVAPASNPIAQISDTENNRLKIAKIGVDAPIAWDVPYQQIVENLSDGVVHYGGTALPGQNGNVFITGHSSNFWWDKGKFNTVFANLDKLEEGDEIAVAYQTIQYRYKVEKKFVVTPSRIEVLNPLDHSIITLMTCTPVGTTLNRLIVQAKQIEPNPDRASLVLPLKMPQKLPAVR